MLNLFLNWKLLSGILDVTSSKLIVWMGHSKLYECSLLSNLPSPWSRHHTSEWPFVWGHKKVKWFILQVWAEGLWGGCSRITIIKLKSFWSCVFINAPEYAFKLHRTNEHKHYLTEVDFRIPKNYWSLIHCRGVKEKNSH